MSAQAQEGVIYVGRKPTPNYVLAVVTQFQQGFKKVTLKARGRAITRAVDVAELARRFMPGKIEYADIKIGSESLGEPGKERTVSTIEIVLEYKEAA
ncbi:MAG: DNA-binding protein Alba [Thermoprotei archaeon]|nr:MAG: DNA-binding protein Alba [Thermoprotei archaeon]